jgi:hypothetical protein
MGKQAKIPGHVKRQSGRKFEIEPERSRWPKEVAITIELPEDDDEYEVSKLSEEGLPTHWNGVPIVWYGNFSITKGGQAIRRAYKVKIPGISSLPKNTALIICDDETPKGREYDKDRIKDDTIELTYGDPAVGHAP